MSKQKTLVPKIRFKGFERDWNVRKLSEISNRVQEKNRDNLVKETFTNSAEKGIVSQRDFFDKDISNEANLGNYYIVEANDFVYNPRISNFAPVGPIKRNKLGRAGVMSPLYSVFRLHSMNLDFVEHYFSTSKWHRFMFVNGDQGARADRFAIGNATFQKMPIKSPDISEQTQIGDFFQKIDELIALQQEALTTAQNYKKSMLQKMFPQKGEKVPRIRFAGFSEDWERNSLNKNVSFSKGKGYSKSALVDEGTPIILYGSLYTNFQINISTSATFAIDNGNSVYSEGNEIIIPSSGETAIDIARASAVTAKGIIIGGDLNILKVKGEVDSVFLALSLNYSFVNRKLIKRAQGHTVVHLYNSDIQALNVFVPCFKEQQKIGVFFQKLDEQIAEQEEKLENYQSLKKAMLQRMFI